MASVAIHRMMRDPGDLEVDAEQREACRAARGRTPRGRGPGSPGRSAASTLPSAWALGVTVVPSASASPGRLRRPPGVGAGGPPHPPAGVDGAVLDDHQVDGHRHAEDDADREEHARVQPAVEQPPGPAPHGHPGDHRPGDRPARVGPTGPAGRIAQVGAGRPRERGCSSAIGSGHYLSRVSRAFPGPGPAGHREKARRGAVAARSRADGSRPTATGPRSTAAHRPRRPTRASPVQPAVLGQRAEDGEEAPGALTKNMPSAAGSVKVSSIRPAQATTTPETQKNAVTTSAPTSTPRASAQPPSSPVTGAPTAGDGGRWPARPRAGTRGPRRAAGTGRAASRDAPAGRPAGAAAGPEAGTACAGASGQAQRPGGRVLGPAALALGGQLGGPRLARGAAGPRAEHDDDADDQQHARWRRAAPPGRR